MRSHEIKDFFERQTRDEGPAPSVWEWWAMIAPLVSPLLILLGFACDSYAVYCCHSSTSIASHIGGTVAGLFVGLTELHCERRLRISFRCAWSVVAVIGVMLSIYEII